MIFVDIVMILIGLGAIIYSNKMADAKEPERRTVDGAEEKRLKEQWEQLEKRFQVYDRKLEEKKEEQVEDTSERMSALSNEKIMGINEYSDQVIDKIEKNHAEVVFLYDMLNGKQEEIQGLIHDADTTKAEFQDEMAQSYQKTKEMAARLKEDLQLEVQQLQLMEEELRRSRGKAQETIALAEFEEQKTNAPEKPEEAFEEKPEEPKAEIPELPKEELSETPVEKKPKKNQKMGVNRNAEILALYNKGHSVLEISKMLVLGQGEVKFVIDMYGQ